MVEFNSTVYIKSPDQDDEVITFGKSAELEDIDYKNEVSRFGGDWRQPCYTKSYLRAARVLLKSAKENNDFDQLGLPIFYLQRHALELFIKGLLGMLYEIYYMRQGISKRNTELSISKNQLERLSKSHSLSRLNKDLSNTCEILGYEFDNSSINKLVKIIEKFETNPTWSRYSRSKDDENHLPKEVVIPIVEIHNALEMVIQEIECNVESEEVSLEKEIYWEWNHLTTATSKN